MIGIQILLQLDIETGSLMRLKRTMKKVMDLL